MDNRNGKFVIRKTEVSFFWGKYLKKKLQKKFIHVSRYVLSEFDMSAFSLVQSGKDLKL